MNSGLLMKSSVFVGGLFDHMLIIFNMDSSGAMLPTPLKFNPVWLAMDDYRLLVENCWKHINLSYSLCFTCQFIDNITIVKATMKRWLKNYKDRIQVQLKETKEKIDQFYKDSALSNLSNDQLDQLRAYVSSPHSIIEKEDQTWILKSRAIWIKEGDNNTKFFHSSMVRSFKDKEEEGVFHFKSLFRVPEGIPIQEILEVMSKLPLVFTKEMNWSLVEEVL
jgi:hypothetical protein